MIACAKAHDMEARNFVIRIEGIPVPMRCAQCDDPACVAACPVSAISKLEDGLVTIDPDKCIQCRNCYYACTYGMIQISPSLNKPIKCDLCHDRIEAGINKEPICVTNCALQALYYGVIDNIQDEHDKLILGKAMKPRNMVAEILAYKEA
jgi:Fe-S-cluster-containing dehydrogenase component